MDRINGANTINIGGGRRGFKDEDPVAGVVGTDVSADWLNAIQENIALVIEEAGLELDANDWTLLLQAIAIQSADAMPWATEEEAQDDTKENLIMDPKRVWSLLDGHIKVIKEDTAFAIDPNPDNEADFRTIEEAVTYLKNIWINPDVNVTMQLSAGDHDGAGVTVQAPFLGNVIWKGQAPIGTMPDNTSMLDQTQAQAETLIRAWLPTRVLLNDDDLNVRGNASFEAIAFLGGTVQVGWYNIVGDAKGAIAIEYDQCAIHGGVNYQTGGRSGFWANGAGVSVTAKDCIASHMDGAGFSATSGGVCYIIGDGNSYHNNYGISATNGGMVHAKAVGTDLNARQNDVNCYASAGTILAPGANIGAAKSAFIARILHGSMANFYGANFGYPTGGEGTNVQASVNSNIDARSATAGGAVVFSPAKNVAGNSNSYIVG